MEILHIIDERVDQEMGPLLDIHELKVQAATLVWQSGEVPSERPTLPPMELVIPGLLNLKH